MWTEDPNWTAEPNWRREYTENPELETTGESEKATACAKWKGAE